MHQSHYFTRGTRYYRLTLMQDLFGQWVVLREWGSIPRRTVRWIAMPTATYQEAQQLLASLIERRLKRRYEEVTSVS
jgi:hypothetical protein